MQHPKDLHPPDSWRCNCSPRWRFRRGWLRDSLPLRRWCRISLQPIEFTGGDWIYRPKTNIHLKTTTITFLGRLCKHLRWIGRILIVRLTEPGDSPRPTEVVVHQRSDIHHQCAIPFPLFCPGQYIYDSALGACCDLILVRSPKKPPIVTKIIFYWQCLAGRLSKGCSNRYWEAVATQAGLSWYNWYTSCIRSSNRRPWMSCFSVTVYVCVKYHFGGSTIGTPYSIKAGSLSFSRTPRMEEEGTMD